MLLFRQYSHLKFVGKNTDEDGETVRELLFFERDFDLKSVIVQHSTVDFSFSKKVTAPIIPKSPFRRKVSNNAGSHSIISSFNADNNFSGFSTHCA